MRHLVTTMMILAIGCAHDAARPRSTLDDVPAGARQTIRTRAGSADVRVVREAGDRYEAAWYENGLEREIVVTSAGVIVEQETELRAADVPVAVREAAVRALGGGAIKYVLLADGRYEAETVVDGKEREVTLAADGSVGRGDDDDDADDEDDDDEGGDGD